MCGHRFVKTRRLAFTGVAVAALSFTIGCKQDATSPTANLPTANLPTATPPTAAGGGAPQTAFPNLDRARLGFPSGWDQFESRIEDATLLGKGFTPQEAATIAEQARGFAKSDRRPHPHNVGSIPTALILSAQTHAKAGDTEAAFKLLEEVRGYGGLYANLLKDSSFDAIRDEERFKSLLAFGEAETDEDIFGSYLVRLPPLFPLADLRQIPQNPPFPASAETEGKVVVVFTGPKLDASALETLTEAAESGASAHAIVAEKTSAPPAITVHVANVPAVQLVPDQTAITWFANGQGEVVAFLRPFSGAGLAKAIVRRLAGEED